MVSSWARGIAATLFAAVVMAACASSTRAPLVRGGQPASGERPVSEADVRFMTGMIPHHAQAVLIAGWAESHGARNAVRILCERIVVGQRDEIALMRDWLQVRGRPVPEPDATHMTVVENGIERHMLMPGMLTPEQLEELDRSRGPEFDRLFLQYMIAHHEGALAMVDELFESYGAAQDEVVFRFASDVYADQTTEIDRMWTMLGG